MSIIAKCPDCNNEILYKGKAKRPRIVCSKCKKKFYIGTRNTQLSTQLKQTKKNGSSQPVSPNIDVLRFIDNPDELLLSTAIRELNKPNPDPRWATILINCKKEKITNKTDVMEQFKQLPTKTLLSLLKRNSLEELS